MAPTAEDLAKVFAGAPPAKDNPLSGLETRLEALRGPGYRSPFLPEASSSSPLGTKPLTATRYGALGAYTSVADAMKLPTAGDVFSQYHVPAETGLVGFKPTPLSELLAEKYTPSPALLGAAKFLNDAGTTLGRVMEALRPKIEGFGTFVGVAAAGVENALNALRTMRPRDPYGNPVPSHNAELYVLARWAYQGDYWEAKAEFLNEIGADESADNVLYLEELLRPTFAPDRLDLREPWEQRNPREAKRWLSKRLGDLKRKNGREKRIILPYKEKDEQSQVELFAFADAELERAREAEIRSILPERQYQVLMLLAEDRKQAEIAEELGIGLSTVKTHASRLRENPVLIRALRS